METLNQVLKVLFEETRSEDVIDTYIDKCVKYIGIERFVDERIFCQQMVRVNMAQKSESILLSFSSSLIFSKNTKEIL